MNQNNHTIITSSFTILVLFLMIASISNVVDSSPNTAIADYRCSEEKWTSDAYKVVVDDLLSELALDTPHQGYSYYHSVSLFEETVYGYADCSGYLIAEYDCYKCLQQAGVDLSVECPQAIWAEVTLVDCFMRYSDSPLRVVE